MDWTYSLTKKMERLLKSIRKKSPKLHDEIINKFGRKGYFCPRIGKLFPTLKEANSQPRSYEQYE
jgi:hypothetical protein